MLRPHWTLPDPVDMPAARAVARAVGVPARAGELLLRRGFDTAGRAQAFLDPSLDGLHDPFRMLDMDRAVARIERAIEAAEPIIVHGDYDVDGITSTALLVRYLEWRGARVGYRVPHRIDDGYGLSTQTIRSLAADGTGLVITCDCGIGAVEAVTAAADAGVDVVVTDHHEPGTVLPPAAAILNPRRDGDPYPDPDLAAVGVAFKLCEALELAAGRSRETLFRGLDLVALGTVADLAPMTGENRILVRHGLLALERTRNPGLRALLERTRLSGERLTVWQVGFVLGPRLNALGRMDTAERGVELLLTDDRDEAERIAGTIEDVNVRRREADRRLLDAALAMIDRSCDPRRDRAIVLAGDGWHPGVLGIVASRVVERFHRPTILITLDEEGRGRGSARSVSGFHLLEALDACGAHLDTWGGHRYAAGLALRREAVDGFRDAFLRHAGERLDPEHLTPRLRVDLVMDIGEVDEGFHRALSRFGPYGPGNPEPVVVLDGVATRGYPRVVGDNHLKMVIAGSGRTLDAIGFNLGELLGEVDLGRGPLQVACRLRENRFLGRTSLQARVLDVRPLPR